MLLDWLQAREIIPSSQQGGSSSSPEPQSSKKRTRSATPDAIDLDDLETDDDEIIIVKHMVSLLSLPDFPFNQLHFRFQFLRPLIRDLGE